VREVAVARLLSAGQSNAEIAQALTTSIRTAEHHTEHVLLKLGIRSRAAVGAALRGERTAGV
jgi:DNA-binding NarL/FixJ family response regulator